MSTGSEELERIGKALGPENVHALSRLTHVMPPEAFSAVFDIFSGVPPDAIEHMAYAEIVGPVGSELPYLHLAVLQRAMRAVTVSFGSFEQDELSRIAAGETDAEVLFELATSSWVVDALEEKDPLVDARLRGMEAQRGLLEEAGGAVGATRAAEILGITRQAVDARRKRGGLVAVENPGGRRGWRYPVAQFDAAGADGVLPGLERVLRAIEDESGWMHLAFLLSPEERLGGERPIDALRDGRVGEVEEAALAYGEHVAY